jgi:hypothetical protein
MTGSPVRGYIGNSPDVQACDAAYFEASDK